MKKRKIRTKWVQISVSGMNIEKTLNSLAKQNVEFLNVVKSDYHTCSFEVRKKDVKSVSKFFDERNIKITSEKHFGFSGFLKLLRLRFGILIGIAVFLCFFGIFSNCIFKIEVLGIEKMNEAEVLQKLEEYGVSKFRFIEKSNKEIENVLSENFDEISLVSVVIKGNSIIINIKEKLINDELEGEDKYTALISNFDGMITQIKHIQGTLKVKVGDIIKKGDVLVEAHMFDSKGNQIPVIPKAEIHAETYETSTVKHLDIETKIIRTGEFVRKRELLLFGLELFAKTVNIPFSNFETEEITTKLTQNNLLPLYYRDIFYYEITPIIIEIDFESVKEEKIALAKNQAHGKLLEKDVVKNEYEIITDFSGMREIKYFIVVERLICGGYENLL